MKNKHTQGQWSIQYFGDNGNRNCFIHSDSATIAKVMQIDEAEANAKLIAASPIMIDALIQVKKTLEMARRYMPKSIKNSDKFDFENAVATIGSAIDKATK